MSRPARSLFLFGAYVVLMGAAFLVAPAFLSSLLRLPAATSGWPRMAGLLALVIGSYDMIASRAECVPYIRSSIPVRFGFAAGTALIVLVGQMPPTVLVLGATDIAGAIWTAMALKASAPATVG